MMELTKKVTVTTAIILYDDDAMSDESMSHDEHSDDHGHSDEHSDDHGDDSDEHGDHDMKDTQAMNTVSLGDASVTLDPLIAMDGTFTLGLRAADAAGDVSLQVATPEGTRLGFDELSLSSLVLLDLGQAESGVYRLSGTYDGADFAFPVSVYYQTSGDAEAYLVLAPTPTLANRGQSEIFANVVKNGENVHGDYSLNRAMAGMTHSTDGEALVLEHTHFGDSYENVFDDAPVSNQVPLSFPMVGTWQVNLDVIDEDTDETLSFETFEIEMLEN